MAFDLSALTAMTREDLSPIIRDGVLTFKTRPYLNVLNNIKGKTALPTLGGDYDLFQAGSCNPTPSGDITVGQREFDPKSIDLVMKFCPKDLEPYFTRGYLPAGQQYDENFAGDLNSVIQSIVIERINKTMEYVTWRGAAGGASPIASLNIVDGLFEVISDEITAGNIPAAQRLSGAIAQANIVDTIENMVDAMPVDIQASIYDPSVTNYLYLSFEAYRNYLKKYRSTFSGLNYNNEFNKMNVDGTNIQLVPIHVWDAAGLKDNMVLANSTQLWMGTDLESDITNLNIEKAAAPSKDVYLTASFMLAYQVAKPHELVVNGF